MFIPYTKDIEEILKSCEDELLVLSNKKILLTGCAGFLGRYFIEVIKKYNQIYNKRIKLVGIDNLISSGDNGKFLMALEDANIKILNYDLSKKIDHVLPYIADGDYLIHAAGIASPAYYKKLPLETIDIAINGIRLLLDLAKVNQARVTFFSSSEIYGNPPTSEMPIKEEYNGNVSCTGPRACYDESKRLGETLCTVYSQIFGVKTNIIRPFNVYGPGMQKTDYRVIPNFGFNLLNGKPLKVYGSGLQTRTYCYITDAMSGFLKVIVKGENAKAYNVGNPMNEIGAHDLARKLIKLSKVNGEIIVIDHPDNYPGGEPERRCPSIEKIKKLGYSPVVDINDGIMRFWNFINDR